MLKINSVRRIAFNYEIYSFPLTFMLTFRLGSVFMCFYVFSRIKSRNEKWLVIDRLFLFRVLFPMFFFFIFESFVSEWILHNNLEIEANINNNLEICMRISKKVVKTSTCLFVYLKLQY